MIFASILLAGCKLMWAPGQRTSCSAASVGKVAVDKWLAFGSLVVSKGYTSSDTNVKAFVNKRTAIPWTRRFIGVPPKVLREAHHSTKKTAEKEKHPAARPKNNTATECKQLHKGPGRGRKMGRYTGLGPERRQRALAQSGAQHVGFSLKQPNQTCRYSPCTGTVLKFCSLDSCVSYRILGEIVSIVKMKRNRPEMFL